MMIPAESLPVYALPAAVGIAAFALGLLLGKLTRGKRSAAPGPASAPGAAAEIPEPVDDQDDPTAPIVPMIEMARSPHDRHRDITVGKGIVRQIDFLDSMIKSATKKGDADTLNQLVLLRKEFVSLLRECSVEAFTYDPGAVVSAEMRSRIQIVGGSTRDGERTRIAETIRCGFLYLHGDEETMILRKAEVLIQ